MIKRVLISYVPVEPQVHMVTDVEAREFRQETGYSLMECRKALSVAKGDKVAALVLLQKRGVLNL